MQNRFEEKLETATGNDALVCKGIKTVQMNLGAVCNMSCEHCHISASPSRKESMDWCTMESVLKLLRRISPRQVDLTGGAPEMNPNFKRLVTKLRKENYSVQSRTNLTILLEPGFEDMPEFLKDHQVALVASLPCYLEENVRAQRGPQVYEKSIRALKILNKLGYGVLPELPLSLVYNPGGPSLPPSQPELEGHYRDELKKNFGIVFTNLLTITNVPIGRFESALRAKGQEMAYMRLLEDSFNRETVDGLMCLNQICIGWDGTLYDCDFNLALERPVDHGAPNHINSFEAAALDKRRIVTGNHCFACTAGAGSSCGGALT